MNYIHCICWMHGIDEFCIAWSTSVFRRFPMLEMHGDSATHRWGWLNWKTSKDGKGGDKKRDESEGIYQSFCVKKSCTESIHNADGTHNIIRGIINYTVHSITCLKVCSLRYTQCLSVCLSVYPSISRLYAGRINEFNCSEYVHTESRCRICANSMGIFSLIVPLPIKLAVGNIGSFFFFSTLLIHIYTYRPIWPIQTQTQSEMLCIYMGRKHDSFRLFCW